MASDVSKEGSPALSSRSSSPLNIDESIIATRERRANAGNRLRSLLDAEEPLEEDEIFMELEEDEDFDVQEQDEEESSEEDEQDESDQDATELSEDLSRKRKTSSELTKQVRKKPKSVSPKKTAEGVEGDEDENFSDSDSSSVEGDTEEAEDAGEIEFQKQQREEQRLKKRVEKKRFEMPVITKHQSVSESSAKGSKDSSKKSRQALDLLNKDRRVSKRSTSIKNKEDVIQRLKESEARRAQKIIPVIKKARKMTQEERLAEAKITEQQNTSSLNKFLELEKVRKEKQRAAMLAKRKPLTSVIRFLSTSKLYPPKRIAEPFESSTTNKKLSKAKDTLIKGKELIETEKKDVRTGVSSSSSKQSDSNESGLLSSPKPEETSSTHLPTELPEPAPELILGPVSELPSKTPSEPPSKPASKPVSEPIEPAIEPATESALKLVPDPDTESALKLVPEPTTESAIEPATESATELALEPATDLALEPATDLATDPALEPALEPATDLATDPALEPATEPPTELATEFALEPAKELVSEPVLKSPPESASDVSILNLKAATSPEPQDNKSPSVMIEAIDLEQVSSSRRHGIAELDRPSKHDVNGITNGGENGGENGSSVPLKATDPTTLIKNSKLDRKEDLDAEMTESNDTPSFEKDSENSVDGSETVDIPSDRILGKSETSLGTKTEALDSSEAIPKSLVPMASESKGQEVDPSISEETQDLKRDFKDGDNPTAKELVGESGESNASHDLNGTNSTSVENKSPFKTEPSDDHSLSNPQSLKKNKHANKIFAPPIKLDPVEGPSNLCEYTTISLLNFPEDFDYSRRNVKKILLGAQALRPAIRPGTNIDSSSISTTSTSKKALAAASQPQRHICVITGLPARFLDPISGLMYANAEAYNILTEVRNGNMNWNNVLGGVYTGLRGKGARHAKGVPEGFF